MNNEELCAEVIESIRNILAGKDVDRTQKYNNEALLDAIRQSVKVVAVLDEGEQLDTEAILEKALAKEKTEEAIREGLYRSIRESKRKEEE